MIFKPYLSRHLKNASASYESVFGEIKSEWVSNDGGFTWAVSIPENSQGEIWAPTYGKEAQIIVNGELIGPVVVNKQFSKLGDYSSGDFMTKITKG